MGSAKLKTHQKNIAFYNCNYKFCAHQNQSVSVKVQKCAFIFFPRTTIGLQCCRLCLAFVGTGFIVSFHFFSWRGDNCQNTLLLPPSAMPARPSGDSRKECLGRENDHPRSSPYRPTHPRLGETVIVPAAPQAPGISTHLSYRGLKKNFGAL